MASKSRRRGRRHGGDGADEDFDDNASVSSMSTSVADDTSESGETLGSTGVLEDAENKARDAIEELSEKRTTTRMAALAKLLTIFRRHAMAEFLTSRVETLTDQLLQSRKRGNEETIAGLKVLATMFIQIGPEMESTYVSVSDRCVALVQDPTKPLALRAVAVEVLAIATLIVGDDRTDAVRVMQIVEPLLFSQPELATACLEAWGLLCTRAPPSIVQEKAASLMTRLAAKILESDSLAYQIAAGRLMALIHELADSTALPDNIDDVIQLFRQLATESNKSKSKKELKEQRSFFRSLVATFEEDDKPSEKLKLRASELLVESWAESFLLAAFRSALQTGLQRHLETNAFVRDVFELGPVQEPVILSTAEKQELRAINAANSKLRKQERQWRRDNKTTML